MLNCAVITVDAFNLAEHPQAICFINPKHPSFNLKMEWLKERFREAPVPFFNDWRAALKDYRGLHIVYSRQCPWVARFVTEVNGLLVKRGIDVTVTELKTPQQAQMAPSPYAVFNLVHDGRLLADHYISETRLMNILRKEKLVI